eukprot:176475-Pyramimonas_sp.AAC.1
MLRELSLNGLMRPTLSRSPAPTGSLKPSSAYLMYRAPWQCCVSDEPRLASWDLLLRFTISPASLT